MKKERARVKDKLRAYGLLAVREKNMELERQHLEKELAFCSAPIARYGEVAGGCSAGTASQVEAIAARNNRYTRQIERLTLDIEAVKLERQQIDNALGELSEEEREIITRLYIKGQSLVAVSMDLFLSERTIRDRAAGILDKLAMMI